MFFPSFLSLFSASLLFLAARAAPVAPPGEFLAVAPKVTYPTSSSTWDIGTEQHVDWDTSKVPKGAQNYTVDIFLGYLTSNPKSENLKTATPLASRIPIMAGTACITVPSVANGNQYVVAVYGDSGDISEPFTIKPSNSLSDNLV